MKKIKYSFSVIISVITLVMIIHSCASQKAMIAYKSGAQLWGENCVRCHNSPTPVDFTDDEWKTIGLHMQDRANLTKAEADKIVEFLCSAN